MSICTKKLIVISREMQMIREQVQLYYSGGLHPNYIIFWRPHSVSPNALGQYHNSFKTRFLIF